MRDIYRINKVCKSYPCHSQLEDCTFCFCPFYPCRDRDKGRYITPQGGQEKIWDCKDCNWIHKKEVVDAIFEFILKNYPMKCALIPAN